MDCRTGDTLQPRLNLDSSQSPPGSPDSGLSVSPSISNRCQAPSRSDVSKIKPELAGNKQIYQENFKKEDTMVDPNNNSVEGVFPPTYDFLHVPDRNSQGNTDRHEASLSDAEKALFAGLPDDYTLHTPMDFELNARYQMLSQQFAHLYAARNFLAYQEGQFVQSLNILHSAGGASASGVARPSRPPVNSCLSVQCSDHETSTDSGRGSVSPPSLSPSMPSLSPSMPNESEMENEEPKEVPAKPPYSYVALIAMSILKSPSRKLVLGDIYKSISEHFPYYSDSDRTWKSSVRHNLSLNECFVKSGRAPNGIGYYWSIHSACIEDFAKGDFRRRQARRRARKNTRDLSSNSQSVPDTSAGSQGPVGYVPMSSAPLHYKYHPYSRSVTPARDHLTPARDAVSGAYHSADYMAGLSRMYQPTSAEVPAYNGYSNIASHDYHSYQSYYPFYNPYEHFQAGYR